MIIAHRTMEMTRGKLADLSGVNGETIRYYEKIALMPKTVRGDNGYRLYNEQHLKRLRFIRRARELGFNLKDIEELLSLADRKAYTCAEVQELAVRQLGDVKSKMHGLKKMERTLSKMVSECDGGSVPDCPIIDMLNE